MELSKFGTSKKINQKHYIFLSKTLLELLKTNHEICNKIIKIDPNNEILLNIHEKNNKFCDKYEKFIFEEKRFSDNLEKQLEINSKLTIIYDELYNIYEETDILLKSIEQ